MNNHSLATWQTNIDNEAAELRKSGWTYQEIADEMKVSRATAWNRAQRVLKGADTLTEIRIWPELEAYFNFSSKPTKRKATAIYWSLLANVSSCAYCGKQGNGQIDSDGRRWQMDHIIPNRFGGINSPSNIVKSCSTCNARKNFRGWKPLQGTPLADGSFFDESTFSIEANILIVENKGTEIELWRSEMTKRIETLEKLLAEQKSSCICEPNGSIGT